MQLLACMLARVWSASEATSIWFELVKERRKQVEGLWNDEAPLPFSTMAAAAQSDISRASLAEWDASVRSWLRTADRVRERHQDQLMLLLANINVPINQDTVYSSVISAWKSALETMENLINGMPQAVNEGSCLLALSTWHLYPDIVVPGSAKSPLKFSDPLVQFGGTLTLGLARPGDTQAHGVFWSLSLAHLNFYGRPVSRQARFGFDSRKISFEQFTQTIFGALLGHWDLAGPLAEYPARFFVSLRQAVERGACRQVLRDASHGVNVLSRVAAAFLDAKLFGDDLIHKLLALGGRRASRLIPASGPRSFLGFDDVGAILSRLQGPNERVTFLSRIASASPYNPDIYIIRYFKELARPAEFEPEINRLCGFASAQGRRNPETLAPEHARWLPRSFLHGQEYANELVSEMDDEASLNLASRPRGFTLHAKDTNRLVLQQFRFVCGLEDTAAIFMLQPSPDVAGELSRGLPLLDPNPLAPYLVGSPIEHLEPPPIRLPSIEDLIWCLDSDLFAPEKLIDLFKPSVTDISPQFLTLESFSIAHRIYRSLPDAAISTRALDRPLFETKWAKHVRQRRIDSRQQDAPGLHLKHTLSCVAYLEGGFDLDPDSLERAFALAFEESIYFSMKLTCDPWDLPNPYEVKRVTGNVGKSGLTLLIPPETPMILDRNETSWRLMTTAQFNGKPENHFSKTSMHFSFTEYNVPLVQSGDVQEQDSQVSLLESVVSVYDSGRWIGDVDVLECLGSTLFVRKEDRGCDGKHEHCNFEGVASAESWDDVLDPPPGDCVIRAHGSWVARLATVTVFIEAQVAGGEESIAVFPNGACWGCLGNSRLFHQGRVSFGGYGPPAVRIPGIARVMVY